MTVLVDTSAFYALIDADDKWHDNAFAGWKKLLEERAALQTTSYVLVETVSLLQNRIGLDAVRTFAADVLPAVEVMWVDDAAHAAAFHALLVSGRRHLSLVDCVSFEVMLRAGIDTGFTFDPHFAEQGFRVIPAA